MGSSQRPAYHTGASESSFLHVPLSLGTLTNPHPISGLGVCLCWDADFGRGSSKISLRNENEKDVSLSFLPHSTQVPVILF